MAPLNPHWTQPSHGEVQEVVIGKEGYTTKSFSKITLAPFGLFAKLTFPPCTRAIMPTYATVQTSRDSHLNLNSDLVYINHSCEPSLIFDVASLSVLAGPKGLIPGTELTFFYPSTEWHMVQSFECFCGTPSCRGRIAGASYMSSKQLQGVWLNGYIREMLEERDLKEGVARGHVHGRHVAVEGVPNGGKLKNGWERGVDGGAAHVAKLGAGRMGPTSRELSGEMGGDTKSI